MTKVRAKVYGRLQVLEQRWIHFVGEALDEFLIGEQVNTILGALIKLSIGLEIYIKKSLEDIEPKLIHAHISHADRQRIEVGVKQRLRHWELQK